MTTPLFADHFRSYVDAGYEPRPVKPGFKACNEKGWNKPDSELPPNSYDHWAGKRANYGIGLRLGTVLPDGSTLGVLDVDVDRYARAGRFLLGDPLCGRFGRKGMAWFVRISGHLKKSRTEFVAALPAGTKLHVGELLGPGALVVIPPTIHPDTREAYRWVGKPLLEVGARQLPIIEV